MKIITANKIIVSLFNGKHYGEIISKKVISKNEFHFNFIASTIIVKEIYDEFVEIIKIKDNESQSISKGYIGNYIYGYERNKGISLQKEEIDSKFKKMKELFGRDLTFIPEYRISERNNEYMISIFDDSAACGLYLSFDGRYIYGIDGGHILCDGLWSEYFKG